MIEAKYILSLCDRFEQYLMPLDIHVLRQRYNGQTFKSTYAVGREMHLSDETVRTIENRALDAIAHCLDLEAAGQPITPMRLAKSFQQPVASELCAGLHDYVTSASYTAHRGELLIFASTYKPGVSSWFNELPVGTIVGRVLMTDCHPLPGPMPKPFSRHKWMLLFEKHETFPEPIPYSGEPSYFHVNTEVAKQLPPRYAFSISNRPEP